MTKSDQVYAKVGDADDRANELERRRAWANACVEYNMLKDGFTYDPSRSEAQDGALLRTYFHPMCGRSRISVVVFTSYEMSENGLGYKDIEVCAVNRCELATKSFEASLKNKEA